VAVGFNRYSPKMNSRTAGMAGVLGYLNSFQSFFLKAVNPEPQVQNPFLVH
jgi:hypothetical protein